MYSPWDFYINRKKVFLSQSNRKYNNITFVWKKVKRLTIVMYLEYSMCHSLFPTRQDFEWEIEILIIHQVKNDLIVNSFSLVFFGLFTDDLEVNPRQLMDIELWKFHLHIMLRRCHLGQYLIKSNTHSFCLKSWANQGLFCYLMLANVLKEKQCFFTIKRYNLYHLYDNLKQVQIYHSDAYTTIFCSKWLSSKITCLRNQLSTS